MPAELPAEINRQVNKAIILLSQTSNPSDITIIVKQLLLAAIPIVERRTAKECAKQVKEKRRKPMNESDRGYNNALAEVELAILSRWKMED